MKLSIQFFDRGDRQATAGARPRSSQPEESLAAHSARIRSEIAAAQEGARIRRAIERRTARAKAKRDAELDYVFPKAGDCTRRQTDALIQRERGRRDEERERLRQELSFAPAPKRRDEALEAWMQLKGRPNP